MSFQAWLAWLVAAGLFGVLEVLSPVLVFGMLGVAALAGMVLALLGLGVAWQVLGFVVVSIAMLGVVRPVARRYLRPAIGTRSGTARLVGRDALVVERVDAHAGRVKLAGEIWSARAYDPTLVLEAGSTVQIIEIEGATALVYGSGSDDTHA